MMRPSCILPLLIVGSTAAMAEIPRALPVDPSEITPTPQQQATPTPAAPATPAEPVELGPETAADPDTPPAASEAPGLEDAVRLQIFLDEALFGPGVIDGRPGRFTRLAAATWNESQGHPPEDLEPAMAAAREAVPHPFATAVVPELATDWVDPDLSYQRSKQKDARRMSYRSHVEFMSERYHTDVPFLRELNGEEVIRTLAPGKSLLVPNVDPFLVENITGARYEAEEPQSSRHVVVDTGLNQVRIYESAPRARIVGQQAPNPALVAAFPITPGQERFIKYGQWELRNAVELPYWRYDQSLLDGRGRSNQAFNIPPGPNSPVGIIWMGLSVPGIGIHGTADPHTIGRSRSAGCIRTANWDAIRLPGLIRPGASVEIR
jgi:lipoprotein-anchoring transpeptidase ErfK/SrfK